MPVGVAGVRHDAAALFRFIDSISLECNIVNEHPAYTRPSKDFFAYISSLAESTKAYLEQFLSQLNSAAAISDPLVFLAQAQVIRTLRTSWFQLHQLVKPALDADTLHIPYPLIDALTARLQKIQGFGNVQFAVLHSTELNYFQIGSSPIRDFASNIAAIVPKAPQFPTNLGLIALPYSQANALFLNVALAHEMGHFAFQERRESARLAQSIINVVQTAGSALSPLDLVWCKDQVLCWCEEIYCDLFALWLMGPSFSFAFIELFALSRLAPKLAPSGVMQPPIASQANFTDSHPAPAFRLGEQVRFLKSTALGWWDKIGNYSNHYLTLLADAESLTTNSFSFGTQSRPNLAPIALPAFFQVVLKVSEAVANAFVGVSPEVDLFEKQQKSITEYLSYGVVPSRLVSAAGVQFPSAVALVNSAHLFYLQHLDLLIGRIRGANSDCLECRSLWTERVEMWIGKALEDIYN